MVSMKLLQSATNAQLGTAAVIKGWVEGVEGFLAQNKLTWGQVRGVGLAIPGPYQRYGVLGRAANLPASFDGWNFHGGLQPRRSRRPRAARSPSSVGQRRQVRRGRGGEARAGRQEGVGAPAGPGLRPRLRLHRRQRAPPGRRDALGDGGGAHARPAPPARDDGPFPCGCGRTWGCIEAYTTLSGLPRLLEEMLKRHPGHELARVGAHAEGEGHVAARASRRRTIPLAIEIFDFQARALGLHAASLCLALDPGLRRHRRRA